MKKSTILAAAMASLMAGSAFAADTTLYGNIRLGIQNFAETDMEGGKLTYGFKASEDMGNGMTGFAHIEFEHDAADREVTGNKTGTTNDLSYVGIKGDFGQVTLGTQDDAAGFACSGTDIFTYNGGAACNSGSTNDNLSNAITYVKGFGDVTVVLGATIDGSKDGTSPAPGDHTVIAAQYAADAIQVGFQITSPDSDLGIDDWTVVGGTYTIDDIVIGLTLADDGTDTSSSIGLQLPLVGGTVVAAYDTGDGINDETNIGFHKNLSKSVYSGVEMTMYDDKIAGEDTFVAAYLGMKF